MNYKKLFELRGELTSKERITLTILGSVILILFWFLLAEVLSKTIITQNDTISPTSLSEENRKYYESDSLLVANYTLLETKSIEKLTQYGLVKNKVYPILPSPIKVIKAFPELNKDDDVIGNTFLSIKLNLLGYLLAIIIAIPVGFLLGLIPLFRGLFSKIIDSYRFIPLTAVTGIFIMWLGLGSQMKVSFLAFGIIVYLIPVVVQRIDQVQKVYLNTVFTLGATPWQTIKSVYMPYVFSKLIDDIRVLTAISWTYITIVEMLNKGGGIGELIWTAKRQSRIDKAFAILIIIVIIGVIQDRLFVIIDKLLFPYKHINTNKR
ncbi:ABC transporter permease [Tenacibaculum finnmarkense]|uniref:ABC transporter permease subunit n=1 Tax=Tenacibaculum finnmarkense genomovar finnmarkense TaxID=1458503 RepID=A0AAP1RHM9_9FLAO|nr:ABC transporter permease subunit [Tenacibaculum finnmarkense]MBE7653787.1 ABC transporter permease subunit [Tenacibaculum finnmarkense genomovar finnmarkense]MBE7696078.1 ABC transporter permease subunit [Tenacibaculum finnmarkense genomovar finnmarkense]MCD8428300.1 ABC transporter permease subunit [Tenacibaculum finnmarkense genomovar finnmarkense]MCG8732060.1 ABC transporter permease subunit [Tenacibaculum finnmarkense]MCG8752425.1 ABC transporter permease subunit [Tenacibaculum finnmark